MNFSYTMAAECFSGVKLAVCAPMPPLYWRGRSSRGAKYLGKPEHFVIK